MVEIIFIKFRLHIGTHYYVKLVFIITFCKKKIKKIIIYFPPPPIFAPATPPYGPASSVLHIQNTQKIQNKSRPYRACTIYRLVREHWTSKIHRIPRTSRRPNRKKSQNI